MGVYIRPKSFAKRLDVVCDLFPRLAERRGQRAGSLSGGERQMLSMGRAIMVDPRVLLLDEPSAGLSPALQDEVFINCRRINEAGVSIVMVEQNANRCLQICHRGYVLDQGRNAYTNSGDALSTIPRSSSSTWAPSPGSTERSRGQNDRGPVPTGPALDVSTGQTRIRSGPGRTRSGPGPSRCGPVRRPGCRSSPRWARRSG